jgi:outer membrane protein assembly factor BamB/Icc-related predicted phosphoesterase
MKIKIKLLLFSFLLLLSCPFQAQTEFALLTDLHVSPGNANERALVKIIHEVNESKVPFVIITGDLTNQGSNAELLNVKHMFEHFTMPYYVIPGNHETTWSESATKEYFKLFGKDRFSFRYNQFFFIGFDTGPYMKMGDGIIKQEDMRWIDRTLAKVPTGVKIVSFCHYPFTVNDLGNGPEVVSMLKKHHTSVAFCGHGHQYKNMLFGRFHDIMVRSTFLSNESVAGYSFVRLTNDSVFVNEKLVGGVLRRRYAFALDVNDTISPELSAETTSPLPEGVHLSLVYSDTASIFTGVAIDKKAYYFGNSLGDVKAISKKDGKAMWTYFTGTSLYSTPVYAGNKLLVAATNDTLYAFSAQHGTKLWQVPGNVPFVADGVVVRGKWYQGGYKKFYKIDIATGSVDWCFSGLNSYCQARPAISGDKIVFGAWDCYLYCLDNRSGKLIWKWSDGKTQELYSPANCVPVIIKNNHVIIVAPDRYMTSISFSNGSTLWRSNAYTVRESQGVSQDGEAVFAKLMDGRLLAVSSTAPTFQPIWVIDAGLGYEHAPCPIIEYKGVIYLGSRHGVVVAVDAKSHKILWRTLCGDSEVNQFTIDKAAKAIYFSLVEGKIYRITFGD